MSPGSYNLNLGSEILILVGDIRSRSWPNIGGTYGTHRYFEMQFSFTSDEIVLQFLGVVRISP